jgi:hypothetical protein
MADPQEQKKDYIHYNLPCTYCDIGTCVEDEGMITCSPKKICELILTISQIVQHTGLLGRKRYIYMTVKKATILIISWIHCR